MKEIQLTQGKVALVDDEDFDRINQFKWYAQGTGRIGNRKFYAARRDKKGLVLLHRWLMGVVDYKRVDHKNHNTLDCQRHNLRMASSQQNAFNMPKGPVKNGRRTSSRFKGVCKVKPIVNIVNPFMAYINIDRKRVYLGYFPSEILAAKAYDAAARIHFKEFACLNFP